MKFSEKALNLLKDWEGVVLHQYRDAANLPTIGIGHLLTSTEQRNGVINIAGKPVIYAPTIALQQALDLLAQDIAPAAKCVNDNVTVELNQNQFDALVSFTFNCGQAAFKGSTLLKVLNAGEYDQVPEQLMKWINAGGKHCDGLIIRRRNECKLWRGEL